MKTVYSTSDYPDALIKKGMLEQAGFLVYVENLNSAGGAMPELGFSTGYRIMVPDSDVEEALKFLDEETIASPGAHTVQTAEDTAVTASKFSLGPVIVVALIFIAIYYGMSHGGG